MTDPNMIALGRRVSKDERDHNYLLPRRRAEAKPITSRSWRTPPAFDQGSTSQCVAYSGVRWLVTSPIINKPIDFEWLYQQCRINDEWPGEDYDGTSVRALFKVFKDMGLVGEYRWGFDAETVVNHVLTTGPVVMGTLWSAAMSNADKYGYSHADGNMDEGHAWCVVGANRARKNPDKTEGAIRYVNSWGTGWSQKGRAWVTFRDLEELIKADGEAAVGEEIKHV